MRMIKALVVLVILGFAALSGYAYFGEFTPEPATVTAPVAIPTTSNGN